MFDELTSGLDDKLIGFGIVCLVIKFIVGSEWYWLENGLANDFKLDCGHFKIMHF